MHSKPIIKQYHIFFPILSFRNDSFHIEKAPWAGLSLAGWFSREGRQISCAGWFTCSVKNVEH